MVKKLLWIVIILGIGTAYWFWSALAPVDSGSKQGISITIEKGDSLSRIATTLEDGGVVRSARAFKWYARLSGAASKLQSGSFGLSKGMSVSEIVDMLKSGKTQEIFVTIPEGYTVADVDALMAKKGFGQPGDIISCAFHCDFSTFDFLPTAAAPGGEAKKIGSRLEGYLFPETYSVSPSDYVPKFFLERMLGTFRSRIVSEYAADIQKSGHTLGEIVTMASLVEEESRHDDERAMVAGILWKRLDNNVVLGVDATTRYVLGKRTEVLTKADVEIDSKYNTRRSAGLPPSAIASAGESAFVASLKPKESEYWYYLHGNDGQIHYAITNDDHNANRARYLR